MKKNLKLIFTALILSAFAILMMHNRIGNPLNLTTFESSRNFEEHTQTVITLGSNINDALNVAKSSGMSCSMEKIKHGSSEIPADSIYDAYCI